MLVLSRKEGESIKISTDVEITVISVDGQRVRLGIRAPRSMPVIRAELDASVVQANQTAAISMSSNKDLLKHAALSNKSSVKPVAPPVSPKG